MDRSVGNLLFVGFLAVLGVACSAETDDEATASESESAIDSECSGKFNGDTCGNGGPAGTNVKLCYRGKCKQSCGAGILGGPTEAILCGLGVTCRTIPGLLAGNGNQVGGLCNSNIRSDFPTDINTCDNGVALGGCATGGGTRYKCVAPGGRPSPAQAQGGTDLRYQWAACPARSCTCTETATRPTTCDNNTPRNTCATGGGGRRFKCINPGGASQAAVTNSQWQACPANVTAPGCC